MMVFVSIELDSCIELLYRTDTDGVESILKWFNGEGDNERKFGSTLINVDSVRKISFSHQDKKGCVAYDLWNRRSFSKWKINNRENARKQAKQPRHY